MKIDSVFKRLNFIEGAYLRTLLYILSFPILFLKLLDFIRNYLIDLISKGYFLYIFSRN